MSAHFFQALWNADDNGDLPRFGVIAEPGGKGFKHYYPATVAEATQHAKRIVDAKGNAYFAPALFKTSDNRKAANAAGAYSFWLDIDCGEAKAATGQGYATQREAVQALRGFCAATGLPHPLIVSSGYGLHVYWPVGEFVPAERWRELAWKLKSLAKRCGVRADPARTADIASLMRVPGTMNFKNRDDPKAVKIWHMGAAVNFEDFAAALETASSHNEGNARADTDDMLGNNGRPPRPETPENIARVKAMLAAINPDIGRADWIKVVWAVLSTGWDCAEAFAREWSERGEKWKEGGPEDFAQLVRDFKPDGGINYGTLVYYAEQSGWKETGRSTPEGETKPHALKAAADQFNRTNFVAKIGGGAFVFDEQDDVLLDDAMSFEAFKNFHQHQEAEGKPIAAYWLKWPLRRTYSKLAFNPSGKCPKGAFNLWRGLAIAPRAGVCNLILSHIQDVWCGGDEAQFQYVIRWMALLVQRPWEKPEVALVLRSEEGAGKTIIIDILLKIFGPHGFTTARKDQVAGRFNGHLFDKVIVVLEEAFFAGDPEAVASAKALVTNKMLGYEPKGKPTFSAPNYAHVISLTNNKWAVPAGADARRWMVLDISDARRGDHSYFQKLANEIDNAGAEAFLHHLMSVDLTGFNPRALPDSDALRTQMRETLLRTDPVAAWWMGVLADGEFALKDGAATWTTEIDAAEFRASYELAMARMRNAPPFNVAMQKVRKLLPAGALGKTRKSASDGRFFSYKLPDLNEARAEFERQTKIDPAG